MSAFDGNFVADAIYDLLNVVGVTALVPADRILAESLPKGETPTYPSVQYVVFTDFRPTRVLAGGVVSYKGSYKVVGWTQDDPRAARDLAKALQQAMQANTPAGFVDISPGRPIWMQENEEGDGANYYQAGQIYEIEVEA